MIWHLVNQVCIQGLNTNKNFAFHIETVHRNKLLKIPVARITDCVVILFKTVAVIM